MSKWKPAEDAPNDITFVILGTTYPKHDKLYRLGCYVKADDGKWYEPSVWGGEVREPIDVEGERAVYYLPWENLPKSPEL